LGGSEFSRCRLFFFSNNKKFEYFFVAASVFIFCFAVVRSPCRDLLLSLVSAMICLSNKSLIHTSQKGSKMKVVETIIQVVLEVFCLGILGFGVFAGLYQFIGGVLGFVKPKTK